MQTWNGTKVVQMVADQLAATKLAPESFALNFKDINALAKDINDCRMLTILCTHLSKEPLTKKDCEETKTQT